VRELQADEIRILFFKIGISRLTQYDNFDRPSDASERVGDEDVYQRPKRLKAKYDKQPPKNRRTHTKLILLEVNSI